MKYQPVPPMPAPRAVAFAILRLPAGGGSPRPAPVHALDAAALRLRTGAPRAGG